MRTQMLAVLLVVSTSASAEWVRIAETADTTYYLDPAAVIDQVGARRALVLHDYAAPQAGGIRSRRVSYEVDCAAARLRSVAATEHAEPMGQGRSVGAWEATSEWLYVAPRTGSRIHRQMPYRPMVKAVCAR